MFCDSSDVVTLPTGEFWPCAAIGDAGLPTVFAKAAMLRLAQPEE